MPKLAADGFLENAKSSLDLYFQSVDINLGRNYFVSEFLSMRPFFGVKVGLVDLEQKTRYECGGAVADRVFCGKTYRSIDQNFLKVTDESDYVGVGAELGVNTKWHLAKGFSFFANGMTALVYGYFDVDHKEEYSGDVDQRVDVDSNVHKMTPMVQLAAGLAYDIFFDCDRQHFGISLGYEGQYWWRVNQSVEVGACSALDFSKRWSEDMSMHGVTFSLRWDF